MTKPLLKAALVVALLIVSMPLMAHVVVSPKKVGIGSWTTFTVSVPNEKDVPNTQIKVLVPEGLDSVSPSLKPGWKITLEKGPSGQVSAIIWSGSLPAEFRDDFTFSAHLPGKPIDLAWKAYQTYEKGEVVAWDVDPASDAAKDPEALEKTGKGPYSVTSVVDDLAPVAAPAQASGTSPALWLSLAFSVAALILAFVAWSRTRGRGTASTD